MENKEKEDKTMKWHLGTDCPRELSGILFPTMHFTALVNLEYLRLNFLKESQNSYLMIYFKT